jgi:hypothetical protein
MDTGKGNLKLITGKGLDEQSSLVELRKQLRAAEAEYPNHGGTFYVGQNLELNGSKFRVLAVTKKTITLRVLPKDS